MGDWNTFIYDKSSFINYALLRKDYYAEITQLQTYYLIANFNHENFRRKIFDLYTEM